MNFHRSGVQRECFDPDAHDLLQLQLFKHAVQYAILGPSVHPHVDRVPAAKSLRKSTPLAALFRHIQNRVQHLQVRQTHIAALHREAVFDPGVLLFRDFHPSNILTAHCFNSVNTPYHLAQRTRLILARLTKGPLRKQREQRLAVSVMLRPERQ
jgi:hypothetical protein